RSAAHSGKYSRRASSNRTSITSTSTIPARSYAVCATSSSAGGERDRLPASEPLSEISLCAEQKGPWVVEMREVETGLLDARSEHRPQRRPDGRPLDVWGTVPEETHEIAEFAVESVTADAGLVARLDPFGLTRR